MSFILDALKKSDKKRLDGKVPNLATSHRVEAESRQRRPLWPLLLVLLLTVNAAVLLWLFGPWSHSDISPSPQASAALTVKSAPKGPVTSSVAEVSPPAVASERLPAPSDESSQPVAAAVSVLPPLAEPVTEPVAQSDSAPLQELVPPVETEIVAETQTASDIASALDQTPRLYLLADLPPAVRRDIPEMHISLHAYFQDAQERLVRINNKLLREGALLDGKYLLEEITVDGVIFSYAGYRFQVPLKGSRY